MNTSISSKLPSVGTTIFTVMTKMAADFKATNLGQGFPDFDPDPKLIDLVTQAMKTGNNQYPYMPGDQLLRSNIAKKVATLYGHQYDENTEVTVTSGATEALMAAILAVVNSGDEVVVLEPSYNSYVPAIRLAGGIPVFVPLVAPGDEHSSYSVDWDRVGEAITPKTRLIILNFPHNPTGITLAASDLDALETIVADTKVLLLADEVYEHIVFDDKPFLSLSSRPSLAARTFHISSFGKTYHTTGWKIGYCCAPAPMTAELRKVHQFMVFTVSSPMQVALGVYTADPSTYLTLPAFYQEKHDFLYEELKNTRFKPIRSQGTFFLLADYSEISQDNELAFAKWLTQEKKVTLIPVSAFYRNPDDVESNHNLVRFCFAKKQETLKQAISVLKHL